MHLEAFVDGGWERVAAGSTDADGRVADLAEVADTGIYKLMFDTASHFGPDTFYPVIEIVFLVTDRAGHYHVPLLLSPFGYTTYRGS